MRGRAMPAFIVIAKGESCSSGGPETSTQSTVVGACSYAAFCVVVCQAPDDLWGVEKGVLFPERDFRGCS